MATTTTGAPESQPARDHSGKSQVVVVDLGEPQSSVSVRNLCKGKGSLFNHVDQIVKDLVADGTVKGNAQPVVIVVREFPAPPWMMSDDEDDD